MKWILIAIVAFITAMAHAEDPLPSWNETAPKNAIICFVGTVTTQGSPDFLPQADRIAVFDNDGTLWSEQPVYFQALFIRDRIMQLAPQHPEWKEKGTLRLLVERRCESRPLRR